MTSEPLKSTYLRTQVMTASPPQLRLMLLDGAIKFAEQARDGLERKQYDDAFNGLTRCRDIVTELINSLRPEQDPDLCNKLSALYTYLYTRLVEAGSEKNVEPVDEVLGLLHYERETWSMLLEKLAAENGAASGLTETPAAPHAPPAPNDGGDSPLIGGRVSVQG
ncbi:MAG: flagellar export chaperone FliS [Planctomycetota bacterium]|jgi:flagellar protein FliS